MKVGNFVIEGVAGGVHLSFSLHKKGQVGWGEGRNFSGLRDLQFLAYREEKE